VQRDYQRIAQQHQELTHLQETQRLEAQQTINAHKKEIEDLKVQVRRCMQCVSRWRRSDTLWHQCSMPTMYSKSLNEQSLMPLANSTNRCKANWHRSRYYQLATRCPLTRIDMCLQPATPLMRRNDTRPKMHCSEHVWYQARPRPLHDRASALHSEPRSMRTPTAKSNHSITHSLTHLLTQHTHH
jgi:hypothetical protein